MSDYCVYAHIFPNGKIYIGLTCQKTRERWGRGGSNYNQQMIRSAIKKYGWDNIEHKIIDSGLTKEEAADLEKALIKKYNTTDRDHGYNISTGGEYGITGIPRTAAHCRHISEGRRKTVEQYAKDGTHLREHASVEEAAEYIGGSFQTVSAACRGEKRTAYGFVWRFSGDSFDKYSTEARPRKSYSVTVAQIKDGKIVARFDSINQAAKAVGVSESTIRQCCDAGRGTVRGYEWKRMEKGESKNGQADA